MKKIFLFTLVLWVFSINVDAQNKLFTLQEVTLEPWKFYGESYYNTLWRGNTSKFTYVEDYSTFCQIDAGEGEEQSKILFSLSVLNNAFNDVGIEKSRYIPFNAKWISNNNLLFNHDSRFIIFDVKDEKVINDYPYPENAENVFFCKENNSIAYTLENNLFLQLPKSKEIAITNETNKGIVSGSDYVHRQEFGIDKGIFWSPDGSAIAYYRKDETMVADYPLVDISQRIAKLDNIKYPMAGEKSEEVTLVIYDIENNRNTTVKTGEPKEQYLTCITWGPTGKYIYIGVLNRDQNHLKLNKYNAENGEFIKTLFEEKSNTYVEADHPLVFLETEPDKFVWWSERDGYNHLYLYNTDGELQKQITKGEWVVTKIIGFDEKEKHVFLITNERNPLERNVYKVNMKSGKRTLLSETRGKHSAVLSANGKYLYDEFSNVETPRKALIINNKGKIIANLLTVENTLEDYNMPEQKTGTIKAADGKTDLYYSMILPPDFDDKKKYPVILYVYGGPHSQLVSNSWLSGISLWQFYMAQKGYVMLTLDNRGTTYRGHEFESATFRNLGQVEMQDQMQGIKFLKKFPFVDKERIGVHGWSFGGFMTISLMTNYPDVFKTGVAGGPVIDWKFYEVMYGERYMDTPQTNPEGYTKTSLLDKADKLKGKLLIIHGAIDPVVVWQHSMAFVEECIKHNVQVDYFMYPRHEHNVRGKDRLHLMTKISNYFDDYLK